MNIYKQLTPSDPALFDRFWPGWGGQICPQAFPEILEGVTSSKMGLTLNSTKNV